MANSDSSITLRLDEESVQLIGKIIDVLEQISHKLDELPKDCPTERFSKILNDIADEFSRVRFTT